MSELMIGVSAFPQADARLIQDAGIRWVRRSMRFPFVDRMGGRIDPQYAESRAQAQAAVDAGLRVMGVTPLPGIGTREPGANGRLVLKWRSRLPDWLGGPGTDEFLANYEAACGWLAEDLRGVVTAWQIANELDIVMFAGPLDPRQGCELIARGPRSETGRPFFGGRTQPGRRRQRLLLLRPFLLRPARIARLLRHRRLLRNVDSGRARRLGPQSR